MHRIPHDENENNPCNYRCGKGIHYDIVYVNPSFRNVNNKEEISSALYAQYYYRNQHPIHLHIHNVDYPKEVLSVEQYYPITGYHAKKHTFPIGIYYSI